MSYEHCSLCPRMCLVDRTQGDVGFCGMPQGLVLSRAALHQWEEPCISGTRGSGTIFFSGCSMRCLYCQNKEIAESRYGKEVSDARLLEIFWELLEAGAHNINLVTPTHYMPTIREAMIRAKNEGFPLPFVYNTSGYERQETLATLEGLVDIYLTDYRYRDSQIALAYSKAGDYPTVAKTAILEMVRQQPTPVFDEDGMMRRGVIVRLLLLPGHVIDAKLRLHDMYHTHGDHIYISLMRQYTPREGMPPPLDRPVTDAEYLSLLHYAENLEGLRGFTQEKEAASDSFIPPFDTTGV